MNNLHLIAHKVHSKPAFDVAARCDDMGTASDPGPWWIIPTSGHRAYPYWHEPLIDTLQLAFEEQFIIKGQSGLQYSGEPYIPEMPADWPDHYESQAAPSAPARPAPAGVAALLRNHAPTLRISRRRF